MNKILTKIVATIHSIAGEAKGPSYSVRRVYEDIVKLGHQVTLVDTDYSPESKLLNFSKSFPVGFGPAKLGRSPAMFHWLKQMAKSGEINLIHNHGLWMMPNIYPSWVAKKYHIPLITSPRGTLSVTAMRSGSRVKKYFWHLVQHPALVPTTCFHATAELEYLDIRRMGFKQPVAIIPNGIDIPQGFVKQSTELKTLLFLGRIHPIKGLDMLLPAWKIIQDKFPNWCVKIIGPNDYRYLEELQNLAATLNLQRINFIGPLFGKDKWQEYHNADLFVLPTYSENFAMSVAEALACGTPALVTKGAPWQLLETYNAGKWIDIDLDSLVNGLDNLMSRSAAELAQMGQNGKELMINHFSWPRVAQMMADLYYWVIHGGAVPDFVKID